MLKKDLTNEFQIMENKCIKFFRKNKKGFRKSLVMRYLEVINKFT